MNKFVKDLTERVLSTYVQVFLGLILAAWTPEFNIATAKAAAIASVPAALSVLKGLIAKQFGQTDSASLVDATADYGYDDVE